MANHEGSRDGDDDLPDVRGEPEPDWVEDIRRRRRARAERLKAILGRPAEDPATAAPGEAPPAEQALADGPEAAADASEPSA
ncbi:MAG TPA: hypothetical protein VFP13_07230 [Actinomycetota bacterium]|nr:hypothetical protein [Actinomycetota bacterium]